MFCLDVKSLYPSVPRKEAREACEEALNNRSSQTLPTDDVLQMLDMVLENNNFCFNGQNFLQTEGTAIGSHLGMNYACTFLGQWESKIQEKSHNLPSYFWRYVDDIWGIWEHGIENLLEFHELINTIHPRIKTERKLNC